MIRKNIILLTACSVMLMAGVTGAVYATNQPYRVQIKRHINIPCGEQTHMFNGLAQYEDNPQFGYFLRIALNGNIILEDKPNPPTNWQTPPQLLTVGDHIVMAGVGPLGGPRQAEDVWKFTIEECEPEPTPEPTPTPEPGRETSFSLSGPTCTSNQIHADVSIKDNDNPVKGVNVEFTYKGETKWVETNTDGKAGANFEFRGEDKVKANPGGEGTAKPTDEECESAVGGPEAGQVLGASTLANTGTATEDAFALLFVLGAGLISVGVNYVTKQA